MGGTHGRVGRALDVNDGCGGRHAVAEATQQRAASKARTGEQEHSQLQSSQRRCGAALLTFMRQTSHLGSLAVFSFFWPLRPDSAALAEPLPDGEARPAAEKAQPMMPWPWDEPLRAGAGGLKAEMGLTIVKRCVKADGGKTADVTGDASVGGVMVVGEAGGGAARASAAVVSLAVPDRLASATAPLSDSTGSDADATASAGSTASGGEDASGWPLIVRTDDAPPASVSSSQLWCGSTATEGRGRTTVAVDSRTDDVAEEPAYVVVSDSRWSCAAGGGRELSVSVVGSRTQHAGGGRKTHRASRSRPCTQ